MTNIASGTTEETNQVIENGAVPRLVKLLGSDSLEIGRQTTFALRNIAADNLGFRNIVLQGGAIRPLIKLIENDLAENDIGLLKQGHETLSCLCREGSEGICEELGETVPLFAEIVKSQEDVGILKDALWPLVYLSDKDEERIQAILDTGVVPFLVKLIE